MKKPVYIATLFISLTIGIIPNAFSWDAVGHKLIATIAYENLTPEAKFKIDKLTCALEPTAKNGNCDHAQFNAKSRFLYGAIWPDLLRKNVADFNTWHYVDDPTNPNNPHNVIWAIDKSKNALANSKYNIYEKAVFLRFLLHFVGDVHQPLHCYNNISQTHPAPSGDHNGNFYKITSPYASNLHQYWDRGLGLFCSQESMVSSKNATPNCEPLSKKEFSTLIRAIKNKYPKSYFGAKINNTNALNLAKESSTLASDNVYAIPENTAPTQTYIDQGQNLTAEQIALAGYRLANLLNTARIDVTYDNVLATKAKITETEAVTAIQKENNSPINLKHDI